MINRLVLTLFLALTPVANASDAFTPEDVLQRLISTYGGAENLEKLDRMEQEWDMVALQGNRSGTDRRLLQLPGQLRVELQYPDKKEVRLLNDPHAYVQHDGGQAAHANAVQQMAMQLQMMRLYSPLALWARKKNIEVVADGDWLALSLTENGLQTDYLVNRKHWRIEKVAGTLQIQNMNMRFLTEYSDFRQVEGVLVHHAENKFAGQVNTARLTLNAIRFHETELTAPFNPPIVSSPH